MSTRRVFLTLLFLTLPTSSSLAKEKKVTQTTAKRPNTTVQQTSRTKAQPKTPMAAVSKGLPPASKMILFAVSQRDSTAALDPIVIVMNGKYNNPPGGDASVPQLTRFANEYYRAGAKYRLLVGGAEAGTVEV